MDSPLHELLVCFFVCVFFLLQRTHIYPQDTGLSRNLLIDTFTMSLTIYVINDSLGKLCIVYELHTFCWKTIGQED